MSKKKLLDFQGLEHFKNKLDKELEKKADNYYDKTESDGRFIKKSGADSTDVVPNLNADMVDGLHAIGINGIKKTGVACFNGISGSSWYKAASITLPSSGQNNVVTFLIKETWTPYKASIVVVALRTSQAPVVNMMSGNIPDSYIRVYYYNDTAPIELWLNNVSGYGGYEVTVLNESDRYSTANCTILYSNVFSTNQTLPSTSYVTPTVVNFASQLATPRTLWGQSFDGNGDVSGNMTVEGNINVTGKVIAAGGMSQASVSTFSTLTQADAIQNTRMRAKAQPTMIVEAGKQYYNDEENTVVSEYNNFTSTNQEAKILSKYPMTFAGENVIVENNDIMADYLMYTLKYMQISEEKYLIAVSVSVFTSNGGDGFDVVKDEPISDLMPEDSVIIDVPSKEENTSEEKENE